MAAPAKTSRSRSRAPKAAVERRIVVALDGPASSGKSSVGAAAAGRLGLRFVDTGLLYRALTAAALREGIATDDAAGLVALADRVTLGDDGTGRLTTVLLDGTDTTAAARGPEVDAAVSAVSRQAEVRAALLRASARSPRAAGSSSRGATSARSCCRTRTSSCSSTPRWRSGRPAASTSAAWTRRATKPRRSAPSSATATPRTATAPWLRSGPRTTP